MTPLIIAAQNGHVAIVRELVSRTSNLDHCTAEGRTALMCATSKGHADVERVLVLAGASRYPTRAAFDAEDFTEVLVRLSSDSSPANSPDSEEDAAALKTRETLAKLLG